MAWLFHDLAFSRQEECASPEGLTRLVASLNLDEEELAADIASPELNDLINEDTSEAESFGFAGTPCFLINGVSIRGAAPKNEFEQIMMLVSIKDKKARLKAFMEKYQQKLKGNSAEINAK